MRLTLFLPLALLTLLLLPAPASAQVQQCCLFERSQLGFTWSLDSERPCRVKPENENCRPEIPPQCANIRTEGGGSIRRCTTEGERETDILCNAQPAACKAALIQTLINCPNLTAAECETGRNGASCFAYNNRCYSRVDGNVCPQIRDPDNCAKSSRCRWRDNRCLSLLEAGLSGQYTKSADSPLPDCAFGGTCRDVNDLLRLALNYSKKLFSLLGVIGFVMFIYGGITMVLSFGSPEKFKQGQLALTAAIIGIVIALSAYLLVNFILNAIGATAEFRAI